ncbi:hypothetical protein ES754_05670 [Psychrobacter frigidicola]|uniref:Uncharacterized protein n=1 Tax=Psychrobacter frigidicola TaxID=45611 RepID=A0A5C7A6T3_9GAMM|nr:hypothetical protein [Psychrobacter frigidicola]TXD98405.1 hypothetical protein ES754_05670 [Psychrobacter frigidicola]
MTTNKSVADYLAAHLSADDDTNTQAYNDKFSESELAATLNAERLEALLQECDNFLAFTEQDIADFEDKPIKITDKTNDKK